VGRSDYPNRQPQPLKIEEVLLSEASTTLEPISSIHQTEQFLFFTLYDERTRFDGARGRQCRLRLWRDPQNVFAMLVLMASRAQW
jgi:hypothetical protein